jgi:hypothetical protein
MVTHARSLALMIAVLLGAPACNVIAGIYSPGDPAPAPDNSGDDAASLTDDSSALSDPSQVGDDGGAVDLGDAGTQATTADGPIPLEHFADEVGRATCTLMARCCAGIGARAFDVNRCSSDENHMGFGAVLPGLSIVIDGGHLAYDPAKGGRCAAGIAALQCPILGTDRQAVQSVCYDALFGTIPQNGVGCRSSLECARTAFCDFGDGGTTGTCRPLVPKGGACDPNYITPVTSDTVATSPNEQCSYRGTGAACDGTSNTCVGLRANGESCILSGECASGACDYGDGGSAGGACAKTQLWVDSNLCAFYAPDAGS